MSKHEHMGWYMLICGVASSSGGTPILPWLFLAGAVYLFYIYPRIK